MPHSFDGLQVSHALHHEILKSFDDSCPRSKVTGELCWLDGHWQLRFNGPWGFIALGDQQLIWCSEKLKQKLMRSSTGKLWIDNGDPAAS